MAQVLQSLTMKQALLGISAGMMLAFFGATGCSAMNERVLPTNLETRIAESGTADDYFAAALLYQQEAQKQAEKAGAYERRAEGLNQHVDPKGFRRAGLITAAQEHRKEAATMQQLYAAHRNKALTMTGKRDIQ
ncbi:MAG: hypothetical protein ACREJU_20730 [Nitrospiraceae bacterium]